MKYVMRYTKPEDERDKKEIAKLVADLEKWAQPIRSEVSSYLAHRLWQMGWRKQ